VTPHSILLTDYAAPGATEINLQPASFASGAGYLFITHPKCNPVLVRFNSDENTFEVAEITLYVRDFEGVTDNLGIAENPVDLSAEHYYNLKNQGWFKRVRTGANSNEAGGGSGFTTNESVPVLVWEDL
jgi:hypothetical protein